MTSPANNDVRDPDDHTAVECGQADEDTSVDNLVTSINGADLLDQILAFQHRFICYPSNDAAIAHTLWIAHTHLMDAWFTTPRLAVLSPEPGSGKSRVLEITALLVPRPVFSVQASAAYIFRKIADQANRPTILFDEIDSIFGPQARGSEELRAMINSGYRRGATVGRCAGDKGQFEVIDFPVFGAIAMGGLGNLPETILSRSVILRMRRRAPDEKAENFRPIVHEAEAAPLYADLERWAEEISTSAATYEPFIPKGIANRDEDVWAPLLTVAELAGGSWPHLAASTALSFVQKAKADTPVSLGARLLADIHQCFEGQERLSSKDLVDRLTSDPESEWNDVNGRRLDQMRLARMLKQFEIKSEGMRYPDGSTPKGYRRGMFADAWRRYLPVPESPPQAPHAPQKDIAAGKDEPPTRTL